MGISQPSRPKWQSHKIWPPQHSNSQPISTKQSSSHICHPGHIPAANMAFSKAHIQEHQYSGWPIRLKSSSLPNSDAPVPLTTHGIFNLPHVGSTQHSYHTSFGEKSMPNYPGAYQKQGLEMVQKPRFDMMAFLLFCFSYHKL